MQQETDRQSSAFPLPLGWSSPARVDDRIDADRLELYRIGLSSRRSDVEAIGAAADWACSPGERGYFELLERVTILDACAPGGADLPLRTRHGAPAGTCRRQHAFPKSSEPARWEYARSNGVAIHSDWQRACAHAEQELVERERVLRAWLGDTVPRAMDTDLSASPLGRARSYEWRAYMFPACDDEPLRSDIAVVGVFGFPNRATLPLVLGYGARTDAAAALEAATRETAQLLAFLWGEEFSDHPAPSPTPGHHLEVCQSPAGRLGLRRWLEDGHGQYRRPRTSRPPVSSEVTFVDLTPEWLAGRLFVAKALCDATVPLAFGASPWTAHLPEGLRIHPIP
jgi:YcaO cyclodehydratase, ATP-ad Mg2+-binding